MASLTFSLLAASAARAGYYTFAYSGGTVTASPAPSPPPAFSGGEGYGGGATVTAYYPTTAASIQVDQSASVTATLTWQPGQNQTMATDPPPTAAICLQSSDTSWSYTTQGTAFGSGSVDCGLAPCSSSSSATGGQSNGTNYSGQASASAGSPLTTFSVSCPAKASFSGSCGTGSHDSVTGTAGVSYGAGAYPVFLNIGGTTPDSSGNWNILVGQQCTARLVVGPDFFGDSCPCTLSNFRWKVSGTTFESWTVSSDQSHTTEVDAIPATNGTQWYWNDLQAATETVSCTFTVTPPAGQGSPFDMTVTAPKPISVQVPEWTATGTGGTMQVNLSDPAADDLSYWLYAGSANSNEAGGMDWNATVSPPVGNQFGTGSLTLVQLITYNASYTAYNTAGVVATYYFSENNQVGLDGEYPYPWTQPAPNYFSGDVPGVNLTDNKAFSAQVGDKFEDFLMYIAPGSNQPVPIAHFVWDTNGSAIIPSTGNWKDYGSTSSGYVSPTGPPASFLAYNTFPKWTQNNIAANGDFVQLPQ